VDLRRRRPVGWGVLAEFVLAIGVVELFNPHITPPGWPTTNDALNFLLIVVGTLVLATNSRVPAWAIGLFGLYGWTVLMFSRLGDGRLRYLVAQDGSRAFEWFWVLALLVLWFGCRFSVLLRPPEVQSEFEPDSLQEPLK